VCCDGLLVRLLNHFSLLFYSLLLFSEVNLPRLLPSSRLPQCDDPRCLASLATLVPLTTAYHRLPGVSFSEAKSRRTCSAGQTLQAAPPSICPRPDMCDESRTLSTQVGGVYRRLAEARPRKADHVRGQSQSECPTRTMTSDSAWPLPEPRAL